jgi:hypothetical protein
MPVNLETDTGGGFAVVSTPEELAREALTTRAQNELRDEVAGDAGTVRVETEGLLPDSEELDRQLTAVAAVADGFESAIAR